VLSRTLNSGAWERRLALMRLLLRRLAHRSALAAVATSCGLRLRTTTTTTTLGIIRVVVAAAVLKYTLASLSRQHQIHRQCQDLALRVVETQQAEEKEDSGPQPRHRATHHGQVGGSGAARASPRPGPRTCFALSIAPRRGRLWWTTTTTTMTTMTMPATAAFSAKPAKLVGPQTRPPGNNPGCPCWKHYSPPSRPRLGPFRQTRSAPPTTTSFPTTTRRTRSCSGAARLGRGEEVVVVVVVVVGCCGRTPRRRAYRVSVS
jgi:hypothetical protein